MEALLTSLFLKLNFFATGLGLLLIGALAMSIILFWSWRWALLSLLAVQTGVAVLVMQVHGAAQDWAALQIGVMALCLLLLALSAQQVQATFALRRPGSWLLRGLTLLLLLASWRVFNLKLAIPAISPQIMPLFLWLGVCTLILLSLGDDPFFIAIALLLWCVPVQAMVEILLPAPQLFMLINIIEIVMTLACSYLMLTARAPSFVEQTVVTDLSFPTDDVVFMQASGQRENGASADPTLGGSSQPRRSLPPELTSDYPFAVGRSQ